nr:hypothetical protein [Tanacetum cinerariifolium]
MVDEHMVVPAFEDAAELVAEAEEEQVIALAVHIEEGQMDVPMIDMKEDLAVLFGEDDNFEDDNSEGFDGSCHTTSGASDAAIEQYGHRQLMQKINQVSDAEVAASVTIREIGPMIYTVEGQVQVMTSQMVHATDRWEERDKQLQTIVTEMGSRESTLIRCILGLERRIAALEKRPPGP